MKTIIKTIAVAIVLLTLNLELGTWNCSANNLTLGNTITIASASQISFTIKWDNSWYVSAPPANWDAVWLFVKYKDCSTTDWKHAKLSTTGTDHTVTGGKGLLNIEMPAVNDGNGVFVRRKATGTGNIDSTETVTLKLSGITTGTYNFKVFGIEMVKVLQDSFYLGDGVNGFSPVTITSEAAITSPSNLPAAYPKGYNAFYCMKHEITQEQYVNFLNCLTYDQQASRTNILPNTVANNWALNGSYRNGIKLSTQGIANTLPAVFSNDVNNNGIYNQADDGQNIPCNFLSWADFAAYLDWACLRPMTELEYEKTCRGIIGRIANEYAWGNSTELTLAVSSSPNSCASFGINNRNTASEVMNITGNGLCAYGSGCSAGPIRAGFAATATTNRVQAGAAYYGALDMSGNVWEQAVSTNTDGSKFTGTLGDGNLSTSNADWPAKSGRVLRGGCWWHGSNELKVSYRNSDTSTDRHEHIGGRGVR